MELVLSISRRAVWRFRRAYGTRRLFVNSDPALETPGYYQTVPPGPASVRVDKSQQIS